MQEASLEDVIAQAEKSSATMVKLIRAVLKEIPQPAE
jgi:purine-nucleoside phosphorylase